MVISGSLSKGLEVKLDTSAPIEDIAVGRYVIIEGVKHRFFGMITDLVLDNTNPQIEKTPPDVDNFFLREVYAGTSTFGRIHVSPMLVLDQEAEEPRPVAERRLQIDHCLISRSPLDQIDKVYSKDQALGQCRDWLALNLPSAELIETTSTARAVEIAVEEDGAAAIAGSLAAEKCGLPVVEKAIQDRRGNHTRFLVLGRPGSVVPVPEERARTALVLSLQDAPGALQSALGLFAERGINLSRIESRPSRRKAWDYLFFIEFAGSETNPVVREVLAGLRDRCAFVKELGSFPLADGLD